MKNNIISAEIIKELTQTPWKNRSKRNNNCSQLLVNGIQLLPVDSAYSGRKKITIDAPALQNRLLKSRTSKATLRNKTGSKILRMFFHLCGLKPSDSLRGRMVAPQGNRWAQTATSKTATPFHAYTSSK